MSQSEASAASPRRDLVSAAVLAALAVAVMVMALELDSPEGALTAPGLLPFVTALVLLLMSLALGWQAVKAGATRGFAAALAATLRGFPLSTEDRRAALLAAFVLAYVLVVGHVHFELLLSGFELVSIVVITAMLRVFWQASLLRCFIVTVLTVESLALSFRYGFNLIMPEAF